jgi:branched-chain amino acid transport system substrate-binding protein
VTRDDGVAHAPAATDTRSSSFAARVGVAALVIAASAAFAAGSAGAPAAPGTLRIYSSLPLQGSNRPSTLDVLAGERMALEEDGGVAAGHPIEFISLDDATHAAGKWAVGKTLRNAERAAQDPSTIAYLGEYNSGASALSIPILNEAGILQVSPSNTYVGLTRREGADIGEPDKYYPSGNPTYGRVAPADHLQAAAIVTLLASLDVKRVLLVDDGEVYGSGLARMVGRRAAVKGMRVLGPRRAGPISYGWLVFGRHARAGLTRLVRRAQADAMVFGGITDNYAVRIFNTAHQAAPRMMLIGDDGVAESYFTKDLRASTARRTLITTPGLPSSAYTPGGQMFVEAFRVRFGHEPDPFAIFGYEAMKVVLAAINAGGGRRAATINAFFTTHNRDSVLGRYSIDSHGDTTLSTYGVNRVEHRQLVFDHVVDSRPSRASTTAH